MIKFMIDLTKIQMTSPKSELYLGSLDLNTLSTKFLLYNDDELIDIFWSAFSQLGGNI